MPSSIKSFLILTWVSLICVFIGWSYARHSGLDKPIKPPLQHPFLHAGFTVIARQENSWSAKDPWSFYEAQKTYSPELVLWFDIRPRLDGKLVVARKDAESGTAFSIDEIFTRFPDHRLILNFHANRPGAVESLAASLEKAGAVNRVLIQSPEDGFLKDAREAKPIWIFGTSMAQVTRLIMLSSIGLESQSPIRGDVVIVDDSAAMRRIDDTAIREAHRRLLRIFAGPAQSREEILKLRTKGIDGVITERPEETLDLIAK